MVQIQPSLPNNSTPTQQLRVLHLAGSRVSDFYYNLSIIYTQAVIQPAGVINYYAVVHPDGLWQIGSSLELLSAKISLSEMISRLPQIDVVIPHMFCFPGMTSYRAFFEDILGIPVVGSLSHCTAVATNKSQTRSVVKGAGVRVAQAQQLRRGDILTMQPPFVVKPNSEDNSLGVTLVREKAEIDTALQTGFQFDDTLLVEEYIPGREIRVAVIERNNQLVVPSMIEYLFTPEHPIRTTQDKLELQTDGTPKKQPDQPTAKPVCPANVTPELFTELAEAAKIAHIALGCRDYSLYDFRIHADTNQPYFLEAGLFWSFGKISMISRMLEADGENLEQVAGELWYRAANRTRVACGSLFKGI